MRTKPRALFHAIRREFRRRGVSHHVGGAYRECDVLFLYGWGGRHQQAAIRQHTGHYVAFDLGYWQRGGLNSRMWRVSIDGFHCPQIMATGPDPDPRRYERHRMPITTLPPVSQGPILLIGNGPKSQAIVARDWSANMSREIRKHFPGRAIFYKPKPDRPVESGVLYDRVVKGEIAEELRKVALVVCRHSNVAVDAARVGVPVVCEDGAGAMIYPSSLASYALQPSLAQREGLLHRAAWWQWSISEIEKGAWWPWMSEQLARL